MALPRPLFCEHGSNSEFPPSFNTAWIRRLKRFPWRPNKWLKMLWSHQMRCRRQNPQCHAQQWKGTNWWVQYTSSPLPTFLCRKIILNYSPGAEMRLRFRSRQCRLEGKAMLWQEQQYSGGPSLSSTSIIELIYTKPDCVAYYRYSLLLLGYKHLQYYYCTEYCRQLWHNKYLWL